jgi:hypothetical protein
VKIAPGKVHSLGAVRANLRIMTDPLIRIFGSRAARRRARWWAMRSVHGRAFPIADRAATDALAAAYLSIAVVAESRP